jgi:hypothetical protein
LAFRVVTRRIAPLKDQPQSEETIRDESEGHEIQRKQWDEDEGYGNKLTV